MNRKSIALAALVFFSAPGWSGFQEREYNTWYIKNAVLYDGNDSNLLIVFYVQIMPDDLVMQLHRF